MSCLTPSRKHVKVKPGFSGTDTYLSPSRRHVHHALTVVLPEQEMPAQTLQRVDDTSWSKLEERAATPERSGASTVRTQTLSESAGQGSSVPAVHCPAELQLAITKRAAPWVIRSTPPPKRGSVNPKKRHRDNEVYPSPEVPAPSQKMPTAHMWIVGCELLM